MSHGRSRGTGTEHGARHGVATPRGDGVAPARHGGHFGRMFGFLSPAEPGDDAMRALYELLERASHGESPRNRRIPAGYTYLGQFVDHDITFDASSRLGHDNAAASLVNVRTPRLDLDSLYGSGPDAQPFLYDWQGAQRGVKLLVGGAGRHAPTDGDDPPATVDLPRNHQGRALIGDARNDENLITSQLHLLFIGFHNRVVGHLCSTDPALAGTELFEQARRTVRWHYQWIVVHDLLQRLVGSSLARSVLIPGTDGSAPHVVRRFYSWQEDPWIPVEFSGAAYRCGHSMVRNQYRLTRRVRFGVPIMPAPGSHDAHLGGFRRLPASLRIGWDRFFEMDAAHPPQPSLRMDATITHALFSLPPDGSALPDLNLRRGLALGLPAGADVAHAIGEDPLSGAELGLDHADVGAEVRGALFRATPLWYYLLCEAHWRGENGQHLGPVGGRIVAEVLVGLLEGDPQSYLRQWPAWRPTLPAAIQGDFTMPDLVRFAHGETAPAIRA